jgi:hypothetical protein
MPERRRKYTPEFKDEAARMVVETSRPIAEVARERLQLITRVTSVAYVLGLLAHGVQGFPGPDGDRQVESGVGSARHRIPGLLFRLLALYVPCSSV